MNPIIAIIDASFCISLAAFGVAGLALYRVWSSDRRKRIKFRLHRAIG